MAKSADGFIVIVRAVERAHSDFEKDRLVEELHTHVYELITSAWGCKVLSRCIDLVRSEALIFIGKELEGRVQEVIHLAHACKVLQACIEHMRHDASTFIVQELCGCAGPVSCM